MSILNKFFKNNAIKIKHVDSLLNDDGLQWGLYGSNQDRFFKDKTTELYTKVFLSDDKKRWIFVDYLYHKILFNLNTKINKLLKELYNTYLFKNEHYYLVFKGGNVMNLFYSPVKSQINEYKKNCSYEVNKDYIIKDVKDFLDDLDNNFQISDVDFSLYIDCLDYNKFLKISHCLKIIISENLVNISNNFDSYYESVQKDLAQNYSPPNPFIGIGNCNETIPALELKEAKFKKCIDAISKATGFTELTLKTSINIMIQRFSKAHQLIKLYLIYEKIALVNNFNIITELTHLEIAIGQLVDAKFNNLRSNNFYTKTKINEFVCLIKDFYFKQNFCVKFKDTYEDQKHTINVYVYDGQKKVEPLINKRDSVIVYGTEILSQPLEIINSDPKSHHYISYNSSILKIRKSINGHASFDLFRIKFNVELNDVFNEYILHGDYELIVKKIKERQRQCDSSLPVKLLFESWEELVNFAHENNFELNKQEKTKYNIPSEFIDLSIPTFNDSTAIHFIHSIQNNMTVGISNVIDNTFLYTDCYSMTQIYDDINIILFQQNTYFPWADKKYEKRIKRLVTMLFISNLSIINGRYVLNNTTRSMLKNLIQTCIIIINSLNTGNEYDIDFANILKYLEPDPSGINLDIRTATYLIKTSNINNEFIDFVSIYKINKSYTDIRYLINFILIFYNLFSIKSTQNDKDIVLFCNIYRYLQGWVLFDINDSTYIISDLRNKYAKMIKTIIEIGRILLLIF
jgi:hypothetical protein